MSKLFREKGFYIDRPKGSPDVPVMFIHCEACGRHWGGGERWSGISEKYACCRKMPAELVKKRDILNMMLKLAS